MSRAAPDRVLVDEVLVHVTAAEGDAGEQRLVALLDGRPQATLRLRPRIGLDLPRCWWHVGCSVHAAAELRLFTRQQTLLLGHDHTGATEIVVDAALPAGDPGTHGADEADTLRPALARRAGVLQRLLAAALLQVAAARADYAADLVVELPGLRDAAGQSPFWQGLGRHFYDGDPRDAQARLGDAWRSHVAALLPRHPVLSSFLPPAARAALAQVDPAQRVWREVLEAAGLRYTHHLRIDDGGPVLGGPTDALPGVAQAQRFTLQAEPARAPRPRADTAGPTAPTAPMRWLLLHGGSVVCVAACAAGGRVLGLDPATLARLGARAGESAWGIAA